MIPQWRRHLPAGKVGSEAAPPRSISYRMAPSPNIPTEGNPMSDVQTWIKDTVTNTPVVLFMKGTAQFPQCGFSGRAIQILKACGVDNIATVNVLEDPEVRQGIKDYSNWPTIPQLYVNGEFIGGSDIMNEMFESGELQAMFTK
jgi:monothiol glutaredoxin